MKNFGRRQQDLLDRLPGGVFGRRREDYQFDQSSLLLAVVGFDLRLRVVNIAWEKSLGRSRTELLGQPMAALVDPGERVAMHRLLNPRLAADGNESIELSLRCKDATYKCFSWRRRALLAEEVILVEGTDITERKRLETTANLSLYLRNRSSGPARR
jgi:PAS domain S-box-containing protein